MTQYGALLTPQSTCGGAAAAKQGGLLRNSTILRVVLLQHVFLSVLPLPLPLSHPERSERCFWAAQVSPPARDRSV